LAQIADLIARILEEVADSVGFSLFAAYRKNP